MTIQHVNSNLVLTLPELNANELLHIQRRLSPKSPIKLASCNVVGETAAAYFH